MNKSSQFFQEREFQYNPNSRGVSKRNALDRNILSRKLRQRYSKYSFTTEGQGRQERLNQTRHHTTTKTLSKQLSENFALHSLLRKQIVVPIQSKSLQRQMLKQSQDYAQVKESRYEKKDQRVYDLAQYQKLVNTLANFSNKYPQSLNELQDFCKNKKALITHSQKFSFGQPNAESVQANKILTDLNVSLSDVAQDVVRKYQPKDVLNKPKFKVKEQDIYHTKFKIASDSEDQLPFKGNLFRSFYERNYSYQPHKNSYKEELYNRYVKQTKQVYLKKVASNNKYYYHYNQAAQGVMRNRKLEIQNQQYQNRYSSENIKHYTIFTKDDLHVLKLTGICKRQFQDDDTDSELQRNKKNKDVLNQKYEELLIQEKV